jgi:hypothetical protein
LFLLLSILIFFKSFQVASTFFFINSHFSDSNFTNEFASLDNIVVTLGEEIVLRLIVESVIVILTFFGLLGLDILISDISPVTETAFHNALDEEKLLSSSPILCKEREVEVILDVKTMTSFVLANFGSCSACPEALKAGGQGWVLTLKAFALNTLANVTIANTAKLWSKQLIKIF